MITIQEFKEKMNEAKSSSGYDLYHRDFSSAMQHAYKHAKAKLGVDVDPEEIDSKVASGPRKPSKGKTNTYRLLDKGGKKAIQVQVYGMDNGKYELNMYKESVDVNEGLPPHLRKHVDKDGNKVKGSWKNGKWTPNKKQTKKSKFTIKDVTPKGYGPDESVEVNEEMDPTKHVSKKGDMYCVYNKDGEEVAKFDNKKDADAYAIKNHDKLMEYLEIGTNKIRTTYAADTPGQTNGGVSEFATGTDTAIAVGAIGGAAYAAKKVGDRFNPQKVAKARQDRADKRKDRQDAEDQIKKQNQARNDRAAKERKSRLKGSN